MLIVCPSCVSAYRMPPEAVELARKAVRCAQCGAVFEPSPATSRPLPTAVRHRASDVTQPPQPLVEPALRPVLSIQDPPRATPRSWSGVVVVLAVAVLGLNMAGLACRARIAAIAPAAAPLFAAIGLPAVPPSLTLGTVETALADEGSNKVLTLEGTITNPGGTEAAVPNLRIVVRDDAEQSLYSWTTPAPRARLGPGEAMDFRSRLVSPPTAGHDIVVSFAGQAETAAAVKVQNER